MFDSHAHYCDEAFDCDRKPLLHALLTESGVKGIIEAGTSYASSKEALALAEAHEGIFAAVGFHPDSAEEADADALVSLLAHPKAVAVGEIGLDYHYETPGREIQMRAFRMQMEVAARTGYPVVIHDRDAHGDVLSVIRDFPAVRGVLHSFSGSAETAKILLKAGWYISFSGVVTFKNARTAAEVARIVPDDRILVETDCPFLTPVPHRGGRNHSGYLVHTLQKLAELRGVSAERMEALTDANARTLFRLPE